MTTKETTKENAKESLQKALTKSKSNGGTMKAFNSEDFGGMLKYYQPQIAQALPKHLTPERIIQQAVMMATRSPELKSCSPESFIGALMQASILGFQPVQALGQCYFVPYNNKKTGKKDAQFIIGYKGLLDLARRSGEIQTIYAQAVYEKDTFTFEFGLNPDVKHIPAPGYRGELKYVYAVVKFTNGGYAFEVMSKADVEKIRARSQAGNSGPWVTDYDEMARKTVLRRVLKYCPLSVDILSTINSDGGKITPTNFQSGTGELNLDAVEFEDVESQETTAPTTEPGTSPETSSEGTGLFPAEESEK